MKEKLIEKPFIIIYKTGSNNTLRIYKLKTV